MRHLLLVLLLQACGTDEPHYRTHLEEFQRMGIKQFPLDCAALDSHTWRCNNGQGSWICTEKPNEHAFCERMRK